MPKVSAFKASDGQLFTDRGDYQKHELSLMLKAAPIIMDDEGAARSSCVETLIENREQVLKLLKDTRGRKASATPKNPPTENESAVA